jgi:hypothetical protein
METSKNRRIATGMATIALLVGGAILAGPASAEAWSATRTCAPGNTCRTTSVTSGTPATNRATVHSHNNVQSQRWPLTTARTTRVFSSQTGTVTIFVYTDGSLHSQSAVCACTGSICATAG